MNEINKNYYLGKQVDSITELELMNERQLLARAYLNHAEICSSKITPEEYARISIALTHKLGFPPILVNLDKASAKYLLEDKE